MTGREIAGREKIMIKVIKEAIADHIWGRVQHKVITKHHFGVQVTESPKEIQISHR